MLSHSPAASDYSILSDLFDYINSVAADIDGGAGDNDVFINQFRNQIQRLWEYILTKRGIISVEYHTGGSPGRGAFQIDSKAGPFFLKRFDGGVRSAAQTLVASLALTALAVPCCATLPISMQQTTAQQLVARVFNATDPASSNHVCAKKLRYSSFVGIFQPMKGACIDTVPCIRHCDTSCTPSTCAMYQLGRLSAADMITNNTDRIPLLVSNEGNGSNVLVHCEAGARRVAVSAIDQAAVPIQSDTLRHEYRARLRAISDQFQQHTRDLSAPLPAEFAASPNWARVRAFWDTARGEAMSEEQGRHFASGIAHILHAHERLLAPALPRIQSLACGILDCTTTSMGDVPAYTERMAYASSPHHTRLRPPRNPCTDRLDAMSAVCECVDFLKGNIQAMRYT